MNWAALVMNPANYPETNYVNMGRLVIGLTVALWWGFTLLRRRYREEKKARAVS